MNVAESVLRFGPDGSLVGILAAPRDAPDGGGPSRAGAIFLNAGLVHRVGPCRQYVELARLLAARGWVTLRFDHSGIGDSGARGDGLPVETAAVHEAIEAMDALTAQARCTRFVLIGMCASTDTAFRAACAERRVTAVVLLNALLGDRAAADEEVLAEMTARKVAHSYLTEKLFRPRSWLRLISGRSSAPRILNMIVRALRSTRHRTEAPPDADSAAVLAQLGGLAARATRVLFVFGQRTGVRQYFGMTIEHHVRAVDPHGRIDVRFAERGDHSFTTLALQREVRELVSEWLGDPPEVDPVAGDASAAGPRAAGYTVPRRRRVRG